MNQLDPWGNPENPYMAMKRQWRDAVDEGAKHYHLNQLLQDKIIQLEKEIECLKNDNKG